MTIAERPVSAISPGDKWQVSNASPVLGRDDVDVWKINLDVVSWREWLGPEHLAADEALRARRFRFEDDGRRYTVYRSTLRAILARYLGISASDVAFRIDTYGKPWLDPTRHGSRIVFNVSHSDDLALVAVSSERDVGIDVERVRPLDSMIDIAARYFSPEDLQTLKRTPPPTRARTFLALWTLKEAQVKAWGVGIDAPQAIFDAVAQRAHLWTRSSFEAAPGYIAALVVEGRDYRVRQWTWQNSTAHTICAGTSARFS
jgi:4'-phosphopantetheinyl transferase